MIILSAGHYPKAPGAQSAFYNLKEHYICREIVAQIKKMSDDEGFDTHVLSPGPLKSKIKEANGVAGAELAVEVHLNADAEVDDTNPKRGSGFSIYLYPNEHDLADVYARLYLEECRKYLPFKSFGEGLFFEKFYFLRKTLCPAVITESLFIDNISDGWYLTYPEGTNFLAKIHFYALKKLLGS